MQNRGAIAIAGVVTKAFSFIAKHSINTESDVELKKIHNTKNSPNSS